MRGVPWPARTSIGANSTTGRCTAPCRRRYRGPTWIERCVSSDSILGGQRLTGLRLQTELETGQRPGLPRLQAIELYPDFTRDRFGDSLSVRALNSPEQWGASDHCRLEIKIA